MINIQSITVDVVPGTNLPPTINVIRGDIRNGMTAVVSIKHPEPRFEGQTKTKLDNQDASRATGKVVGEQMVLYFDRNLETLKTILSCAEKAAKIRKTEERAKTNLLTKQKYSFDSNGKLANCEKKDPSQCEIFIVEGDSAGGSAKTARNRNYQAILPIRGKILNVEKATIDKVLANAEIKTMINAFGCGFSEGYGNDFDTTKLRYDKIVIMADADVDGAHISTLLLTLFYRFMPDLITEGHAFGWDLATTSDFVHYEDKGVAIPRGTDEEQDQFIFAGSVFEAEGQYHIFYTGYNRDYPALGKPSQVLMHAYSDDLVT